MVGDAEAHATDCASTRNNPSVRGPSTDHVGGFGHQHPNSFSSTGMFAGHRIGAPGSFVTVLGVRDVDLAITAANAAAEVIRGRFGTELIRTDKGGGDFATDVDLEAEQVIVDMLLAHRPADRIVAEESGQVGSPDADRSWFVDPLCGTLNFAAGTGPVAVNVALCQGGTVVAAAVADPFAGVVDWTDGSLARRRGHGVDRELVPSPTSCLVDLNLDPPFPNGASFTTVALLADDGFARRFRPRVMSTSLALAWVASGHRAAYVTDGHLAESVHFAAGIALCAAAGCVVTDLRGGPIHGGRGGLLAAADQETHEALLTMASRQLQG
jgi:myo-inositol-1(or 4)-monophosphatase